MIDGNTKETVRRYLVEARVGDQVALELLRDLYTPLIDASAHRFWRDGMSCHDREDIRQEALVNFCNAVYSYDLSFDGIEFGLYAKICIEHGLISFMRSFDRHKKISEIPIDELLQSDEKKECVDLLDSLADREQAATLCRRISDRLSKYENRIWWMYVSGLSVREIAASIGVESKSVSNAVFRIRRKLKVMISSDD